MSGVEAVPKAPRSLKSRGRALWKAIAEVTEFEPQDADLLHEICRILDTIDALALSIEVDGTMITGSQGQPVLHPAVAELRQQQAAYAKLITVLSPEAVELASGGAVAASRATSRSAQAAANARWGKQKRATGGL